MAPFDAIWSVKKVFKHSKKRQLVPYSPLRSVQKRQKVPGVTALRSLYLAGHVPRGCVRSPKRTTRRSVHHALHYVVYAA